MRRRRFHRGPVARHFESHRKVRIPRTAFVCNLFKKREIVFGCFARKVTHVDYRLRSVGHDIGLGPTLKRSETHRGRTERRRAGLQRRDAGFELRHEAGGLHEGVDAEFRRARVGASSRKAAGDPALALLTVHDGEIRRFCDHREVRLGDRPLRERRLDFFTRVLFVGREHEPERPFRAGRPNRLGGAEKGRDERGATAFHVARSATDQPVSLDAALKGPRHLARGHHVEVPLKEEGSDGTFRPDAGREVRCVRLEVAKRRPGFGSLFVEEFFDELKRFSLSHKFVGVDGDKRLGERHGVGERNGVKRSAVHDGLPSQRFSRASATASSQRAVRWTETLPRISPERTSVRKALRKAAKSAIRTKNIGIDETVIID